ncbi:hypothetical protein J437_LFUL011890 [Ladona fulva]|uniref:C2H2-type domain-containing protein n=1 Tax=Ladona fulva TaxID=123851 RepID=A0A8K0KCH7_LADFU|nr:hypothetical protein J437_LFUL011890 [Ladona fulva]
MIRFNYQYVLCRLCLSNNSSLCDIHSSEVEKGSSVAGVVTDLLQLDVSKTDGHPQLADGQVEEKVFPVTFRQKVPETISEISVSGNSTTPSEEDLNLLQEDEYSELINPLSPDSSQNDSSNALPSENLETENRGNEPANENGIQIKQEFLQENMEQSAEENTMKNIFDNSEANPKTRSLLLCIPIAKKLPVTNQPANLPINLQNKVQQSINIIPTCEEAEWRKKLAFDSLQVEHEAEQINPVHFQYPPNGCSNLLLSGNSIKISSVESLKENNVQIRQEFTQGIMEKPVVQNAVKVIPNNSAVNHKTQSLLLCIPIAKKLPGTSPPQIPMIRPPMPLDLPMGLQMKGRRRRKVPPKTTSEDGEKSQISCEICRKTFTQKHTLKIHKFTHMKIKPYQCTICKKDFAQSSTMRRHMSRSHVEKKFQCFLCPRKFAKEKCLEAHIKIHRGYRPFNCSWCNTGFCSKKALEKHEAWHAGDIPFKCDFCGKEFDHKRKISWHIRCSHMTKNEVCSLCGAHFRSEANLKIHMTLHTDERNFMCEVCGKTFRRRNCLSVHRRTHTGERPYQCELCDKRFTQKHCLKGHMERHQRESW